MTNSSLTKTKIDFSKVAELLRNADWTYENCGDSIKPGGMDEYILEINDFNISATLCERMNFEFSDFDERYSNEVNVAYSIADQVAQQIVDCIYPGVTFVATFNPNFYLVKNKPTI